jgi:tetratricopeptide (TPR) repeat protein
MNFRYAIYLIISTIFIFSACNKKDEVSQGDVLYNSGAYQKAVEAYTKHLTLKPSDETVLYNRGRAYEELGEYEKALNDFMKVLKINPTSENALLSYGKYFYREKDYENAAFQFEKAFKLNSSNSQVSLLFARALHKSGQVDKAMEHYNIAIDNDDKNAEAFMYRGALKYYLKKTRSGCNDIQTARNMEYAPAEDLYNQYCK